MPKSISNISHVPIPDIPPRGAVPVIDPVAVAMILLACGREPVIFISDGMSRMSIREHPRQETPHRRAKQGRVIGRGKLQPRRLDVSD